MQSMFCDENLQNRIPKVNISGDVFRQTQGTCFKHRINQTLRINYRPIPISALVVGYKTLNLVSILGWVKPITQKISIHGFPV